MTMHHSHSIHSMSTSATTMSTYGINYFNDAYSSGEYSDGYQSSISPVGSPPLGNYNYNTQNYGSTGTQIRNYAHQNDCSYYQQAAININSTSCSLKTIPNQVDYLQNTYKVNVQDKPYSRSTELQAMTKAPVPKTVAKVNRFVEQFNQKHENLSKQLLEQIDNQTSSLAAPPPEVVKKRRVAANARERRRMNNLNFAFDR